MTEALLKKKLEAYCPLNKVMRQWSDRKKIVSEPLFSCYVFVHANDAEQLSIKQTDGIVNFVYWLGRPAVIRDEEINTIREFTGEFSDVKLERINVNVNDHVRIISGPLNQREGNVMEVKNRTVKVFLPSLGYAMVAEIDKTNIQQLNPQQFSNTGFSNAGIR